MSYTRAVTTPLTWTKVVERTRATLAAKLGPEAIDPQAMLQLSDNHAVREIADDADTRLRTALAYLRGAGTPVN